jgi:hypothetical protein
MGRLRGKDGFRFSVFGFRQKAHKVSKRVCHDKVLPVAWAARLGGKMNLGLPNQASQAANHFLFNYLMGLYQNWGGIDSTPGTDVIKTEGSRQ